MPAQHSPAFDAYHVWLGIAPKDQPPHHYRLLGIDLFECHTQVIENAADQRMIHLRSIAGEHIAESQRLLNEVSAARVCLLDPDKRAAYNQELRQRLNVKPPKPRPMSPVQVRQEIDSAAVCVNGFEVVETLNVKPPKPRPMSAVQVQQEVDSAAVCVDNFEVVRLFDFH